MATISLELLENVGFVNKSQLSLVEPKIPGTRYTEAYQLHGHTPIVGTAHDRSSTRSIQEKEALKRNLQHEAEFERHILTRD